MELLKSTHELATLVLSVKLGDEGSALRLKEAQDLAQEILRANFPRDYLEKNEKGLLLGVAVVIQRGGKYLAVKNPKRGGLPEFPGGGVEKGETIFEAAAREAKEETSVDLVGLRTLGTWTSPDYEVTFVGADLSWDSIPQEGDAGPVEWVEEKDLLGHPLFGSSVEIALKGLKQEVVQVPNPLEGFLPVQTLRFFDMPLLEVFAQGEDLYLGWWWDQGPLDSISQWMVVPITPEILVSLGTGEKTLNEILSGGAVKYLVESSYRRKGVPIEWGSAWVLKESRWEKMLRSLAPDCYVTKHHWYEKERVL
jgi:8-oxo-dGTP pyrophosphatase MutT (NUDIX family)